MSKRIGFIGAGNMASCLIGGMVSSGVDRELIRASEPDGDRRQAAARRLGIELTQDNGEIIRWADTIVIAVKPQAVKGVVQEVSATSRATLPLIVSIAAGIGIQSVQDWLNRKAAIIRVMPNTPALVSQGMSALYANSLCTDDQRAGCQAIFETVGDTLWLDKESNMDIVTAISGSGPAYFFLFMEALIKAALEQGLTDEVAKKLVLKTAVGASIMAIQSQDSPTVLRAQVTSPGGTTEQAVNTLMDGGLEKLIGDAVNAAEQRSSELSRLFGEDK